METKRVYCKPANNNNTICRNGFFSENRYDFRIKSYETRAHDGVYLVYLCVPNLMRTNTACRIIEITRKEKNKRNGFIAINC